MRHEEETYLIAELQRRLTNPGTQRREFLAKLHALARDERFYVRQQVAQSHGTGHSRALVFPPAATILMDILRDGNFSTPRELIRP